MADASMFSEMGGRLTSTIFSSILWFGIAFIIICVLGFLMWYLLHYRKKFDIKIKTISHRAGDSKSVYFDKAAIVTHWKTKLKFFRLYHTKVDLPVPPFNVIQNTNEGDYIELLRKSEDEFYFLMPPKICNNRIIKADGKIYPIASQEHMRLDSDTSYWNVKRKDMNKKMFDTEHILMKVLAYLPQLMGGVIMIFLLYVLMDHLPQILAQLTELVKEMKAMKAQDAAQVVYGFLPLLFLKTKLKTF